MESYSLIHLHVAVATHSLGAWDGSFTSLKCKAQSLMSGLIFSHHSMLPATRGFSTLKRPSPP